MSAPPGDDSLKAGNAAAVAVALWDSADFANAESYFERALRETPDDLEALFGYGRLNLATNRVAAAVALLERAQALAGSLAGSRREELARRVTRELAWSYYRLDRFDLAAPLFELLPNQEAFSAQVRAFSGVAPYRFGSDSDEIALPFLGTDPLPVVTVQIDGKEHAFVIDTGASQLTLDTAFLRELDLPVYGSAEARLASGSTAPVVYSRLSEMTLGDVTLFDIPVEVMDIRRFAPQISGFIGTNLLQRFHVLLDIEGEVLRLRPARFQLPFATTGMTENPLYWLDGHLLFTPLHINDHATLAYLATGLAGVEFTAPESTARQAHLTHAGEMEGVSAGAAEPYALVTAQRVALGQWERKDAEGLIGFFPPELEWRYGFRVGAIASFALLRHRRIVFDFAQMHLALE